MPDFVGAVDQGTTSTRSAVFDHAGKDVGTRQPETVDRTLDRVDGPAAEPAPATAAEAGA